MEFNIVAYTYLGIRITFDELEKSYSNYIEKHPEKSTDEELDMTFFENSIYHDYVDDLTAKYELEWEEITPYESEDRKDGFELCVYVWSQQTNFAYGEESRCLTKIDDYENVQKLISKKNEKLNLFMNDFGLNKRSRDLKMITILKSCC